MTFVVQTTDVVNEIIGDALNVRRNDADVPGNLGTLLINLDEVAAERFDGSLRAWCRKAGVSHNYIGSLRAKHKKGSSQSAKLDKIEKLAKAAGVSMDRLLGGDAPERAASSEESPNLRAALEAYDWFAADITAERARDLIAQLRKTSVSGFDLPVSYWRSQIDRLSGRYAPAESAALMLQSPRVRYGAKKGAHKVPK